MLQIVIFEACCTLGLPSPGRIRKKTRHLVETSGSKGGSTRVQSTEMDERCSAHMNSGRRQRVNTLEARIQNQRDNPVLPPNSHDRAGGHQHYILVVSVGQQMQ